MATTTFTKQFSVNQKKSAEFVKEMTRPAAPTLRADFHTRLSHPSQNEELKKNLLKALKK